MIKLTEYELFYAAIVGVRRQVQALLGNLPNRHGFDGDGWGVHIEGAAGEMAYAKFRNKYWSCSVGTFQSGGDVGEVQVRTRSKQDYDLIVRKDDPDDAFFVLVIGQSPSFRICGWMKGGDAKQDKWLQTHGGREPAYFVPQADLESFAHTRGRAA